MAKITIVILILCALLFGYQPAPIPPLDPNDVPFVYDPNQCPSEPMIALVIRVNSTHVGDIRVTEEDGDPVLVSLVVGSVSGIEVPYVDDKGFSIPTSDKKDPNDPSGMARIYHFQWQWTPTIDDVGLHYINVYVDDQYLYNNFDERTMIILVKENRPPVITGCR